MATKSGENLLFENESYVIRGACFRLYKKFGGNFKESIIEKSLVKELKLAGFKVEAQKRIPIEHQGEKVGTYTPDLIVNNRILIELKAKAFLTGVDDRQFWTYLKASPYPLGFLINFGPKRLEIKRRIYERARQENIRVYPLRKESDPRLSASKGFTLIEALIVMSVLVFIGSAGFFILRNQLVGNLDADAEAILSRLQETQSRAITGVDNLAWGMHFEATSTGDFYAMFSGPGYATTTASTTYYLSRFVEFEDPSLGSSKDIVFQKLTGLAATSTTVVIRLKSDANQKRTIEITRLGRLAILGAGGGTAQPPQAAAVTQLHWRWRNDDGNQ